MRNRASHFALQDLSGVQQERVKEYMWGGKLAPREVEISFDRLCICRISATGVSAGALPVGQAPSVNVRIYKVSPTAAELDGMVLAVCHPIEGVQGVDMAQLKHSPLATTPVAGHVIVKAVHAEARTIVILSALTELPTKIFLIGSTKYNLT